MGNGRKGNDGPHKVLAPRGHVVIKKKTKAKAKIDLQLKREKAHIRKLMRALEWSDKLRRQLLLKSKSRLLDLVLRRNNLRERKVARKIKNQWNLSRGGDFYGFVSSIEGLAEDADNPWVVRFECIDRVWIDKIWMELVLAGSVGSLLDVLVVKNDFIADFFLAFDKLADNDRASLYVFYVWYLMRILQPGHAAPVGLFEVVIEPGSRLRKELRETDWYRFSLATERVDDGCKGDYGELKLSPEEDPDAVERWLLESRFERVPDKGESLLEITQPALKILHFPQSWPGQVTTDMDEEDPEEDNGNDMELEETKEGDGNGMNRASNESNGGMDEEGGPESGNGMELSAPDEQQRRLHERLREAVRRLGAGLRKVVSRGLLSVRGTLEELLAALLPDVLPMATFAWAGTAGAARPFPQAVAAYVGGAGVAGGGQPPNPMVRGAGAHQPFVGVLDVGQGNCNALFDRNGQVIAYLDFGYPVPQTQASRPLVATVPCLCNNPIIIISHWDADHYFLARQVQHCYRATWLAPQQHMGPVAVRETIARILTFGGNVQLWETGAGHMTFDWGFIERCSGPAPFDDGRRNNSGLAVFVCVKDDANAILVAGQPAAVPAGPAPILPAAAAMAAQLRSGAGQVTVAAVGQALLNAGNLVPIHHGGQAGAAAAVQAAAPGEVIVIAAAIGAYAAAQGGGAPVLLELLAAARAAWTAEGMAPMNARFAAVAAATAIEAQRQVGWAAVPTAAQVAAAAHAAVGLGPVAGQIVPAPLANLAGNVVGVVRGNPRLPRLATMIAQGRAVDRHIVYAAVAGAQAVIGAQAGQPAEFYAAPVARALRLRRLDGDVLRGAIAAGRLGGVVPVALPVIRNGNAPFNANERFVLLTGDGNFHHVPSQNQNPPPVVVGLTAAHHGSNYIDQHVLDLTRIPWAPQSLAARVVAAAAAIGPPLDIAEVAAVAAALAVSNGWGQAANAARKAVETLRAGGDVRAASICAACAVYNPRVFVRSVIATAAAAQNAVGGGLAAHQLLAAAGLINIPVHLGIARATIAYDVALPAGIALGLPATIQAAAVGATCVGVTPAAAAANRLGVNQAIAHVAQAANNAFGNNLFPVPGAISAALGAATPRNNPPPTLAQEAQVAAAVFSAIAALQAVAAGPLAGPGLGALGPLTPGGRLAIVAAAAAAAAATSVPGTGLARGVGEVGAITATACLATPADQAAAAAVAAAPGTEGRIAYSYGVRSRAPHGHFYGNPGHPTPDAVLKYEAHGWIERRNTSHFAHLSAQRHPNHDGHIALGWQVEALPVAYEGCLLGDVNTPNAIARNVCADPNCAAAGHFRC